MTRRSRPSVVIVCSQGGTALSNGLEIAESVDATTYLLVRVVCDYCADSNKVYSFHTFTKSKKKNIVFF